MKKVTIVILSILIVFSIFLLISCSSKTQGSFNPILVSVNENSVSQNNSVAPPALNNSITPPPSWFIDLLNTNPQNWLNSNLGDLLNSNYFDNNENDNYDNNYNENNNQFNNNNNGQLPYTVNIGWDPAYPNSMNFNQSVRHVKIFMYYASDNVNWEIDMGAGSPVTSVTFDNLPTNWNTVIAYTPLTSTIQYGVYVVNAAGDGAGIIPGGFTYP